MSALIYVLQPDQVLIAMDTLAVTPDTKDPLLFASKLFPVPHLGGVICGTGAFPVILDWFNFVLTNVVGRNILVLNEAAPTVLPQLASKHGLFERLTATIYHFGYLEEEGRFGGFAYRSEHRFASERMAYGLGMKPPHGDLLEAASETIYREGVPKVFIDLMEEQKARDETLPQHERIGIGGEMHVLTLSQDGYVLCVCHRFNDYQEVFASMLRHMNAPGKGP